MPLFSTIVDRLRLRVSVRRQTIVGPLLDAYRLRGVVRRIAEPRTARVLGPDAFAPYLRQISILGSEPRSTVDPSFDRIIIPQTSFNALDGRLIGSLIESYVCVYANSAYALFAPCGSAVEASTHVNAVNQRLATFSAHGNVVPVTPTDHSRPILMTTFDRPAALRRSLPQLAALAHHVLVVDDGSAPAQADANAEIARQCGASYLRLPDNRGLAAAINVGIAYLLADERTQWISYFQDDVDVDPRVMERLAPLEHADQRPLITGYDADEHAAEREEDIAGERVKLKRMSSAVHIHAHAKYWERVLPIPTQYLGAPKRRWDPSLEDYWIVKDAPESVWRRGVLIPCVPGLVRTFLWHRADSTWGNPNLPEPSLARRSDAR